LKKVLDEEELYLQILDDGFSRGNHPVFQELLVVAKKIKQDTDYGESNIVLSLGKFCLERNDNFNFTLSEASLIKVARTAIKSPEFRKPNFPIKITADEINKIKTIKDLKMQMLLLASVAFARSGGNPMLFSDTDKTIREIIRLSGERFTVPRFLEEVTPLARVAGIFHHVNRKHTFYALLGDDVCVDVVLEIADLFELESLPEVYRKFNGGFPSWCSVCGREFVRDSYKHSKKLCKGCVIKP